MQAGSWRGKFGGGSGPHLPAGRASPLPGSPPAASGLGGLRRVFCSLSPSLLVPLSLRVSCSLPPQPLPSVVAAGRPGPGVCGEDRTTCSLAPEEAGRSRRAERGRDGKEGQGALHRSGSQAPSVAFSTQDGAGEGRAACKSGLRFLFFFKRQQRKRLGPNPKYGLGRRAEPHP